MAFRVVCKSLVSGESAIRSLQSELLSGTGGIDGRRGGWRGVRRLANGDLGREGKEMAVVMGLVLRRQKRWNSKY